MIVSVQFTDHRTALTGALGCAIVILLSFIVTPPACAGEDGGYAGAPAQLGVGGRAVAMGGAYTAIAEGPTGFWWNPAGIAHMREDQLEAAWRAMSFDRQTGYVALLHPFSRDEAAMSLSWTYAGVSDLYETNIDGVRGDALSDYTNAFTFAFGRRFTPVLSVGATLRYMQHNIANINSYTIGFDLGVHLKFVHDWDLGGLTVPMSRVRMGLAVHQLNQKYPWTTGDYWVKHGEPGTSVDERFPVIVRVGAAANVWGDRAIVAVDGEFNDRQDARIHAGAEVRPVSQFALRGGMDNANPTFGAGFELPLDKNKLTRLVFDYAYAIQTGVIDAEHVLSVGVRF